MATRGDRNNNPLNIRKGTAWIGLAECQNDPRFCVFTDKIYGLRAAFCIIHTYMKTYHLSTISLIIGRWAPPIENDTQFYINFISTKTGVDPHMRIHWEDEMIVVGMVYWMIVMESGLYLDLNEIKRAYQSATLKEGLDRLAPYQESIEKLF